MSAAIIFVVGMCIGSFLNVCIYRLPAARSIVRPSSACTICGTPINWYDNIPVLSYVLLRGRCRHCGRPFSIRYPLVELLTGLLALSLYFKFGLTIQTAVYFVFAAALLIVTFIDIDHRIVPDSITLPGIPLGLAASLSIPAVRIQNALLGVLIGGGSLLAVAWAYKALTGKEGMGGGDIKLLAMIGAFVGWKGVLLSIFAASAIGTVYGVLIMVCLRKNMKLAIPFGPFLAAGALIHVYCGDSLIAWYVGML